MFALELFFDLRQGKVRRWGGYVKWLMICMIIYGYFMMEHEVREQGNMMDQTGQDL